MTAIRYIREVLGNRARTHIDREIKMRGKSQEQAMGGCELLIF